MKVTSLATWTPSFIILVWGHHPLIGATCVQNSRKMENRNSVNNSGIGILCSKNSNERLAVPAVAGLRVVNVSLVSAEPFSHGTGTLRWLKKEMATYRHWWSVSVWRDPDDVSHCRILSPDKTEWRFISVTLCGWRHCFVADQLWFMTHIREEDWATATYTWWLQLQVTTHP